MERSLCQIPFTPVDKRGPPISRAPGKTVLFPERLDDCVMTAPQAWADKVRQRHIGDFRQWKDHDAYKRAFERLLRDLKAEAE